MERPAPNPILLRGEQRPNVDDVPLFSSSYYQVCSDLSEENRKLKEELRAARERMGVLEDTLSTLLSRGALPRYSQFLPPYFIARHQRTLAAIDVYGEQYREAVRRGLLSVE
ncbi:uncharacterized protein TM35_000162800 [Trypanosoma theileri]|uniref:Uncharacterized protein n=1 Tax=Trypanosoma theileri TaxID=67003 RepID=A0A1X0NVD6_9TRYP|nr:uncharacterized protein TM35_000162800 [Trypanosoma theileri]ORC88642.1 hypothetical protein TM35_000162800 [Trypanosoma theileri]